jgi:hypothetical protein
VPTESLEVLNVALPLLKVIVPNVVVPSLKVTEPERLPAPGVVAPTVAVKVTLLPDFAGFTKDLRVVAELTLFTV